MKLFRTFALTALLTIGFTIPSCLVDPCNCPPESGLQFFDIDGMTTGNYRQELHALATLGADQVARQHCPTPLRMTRKNKYFSI